MPRGRGQCPHIAGNDLTVFDVAWGPMERFFQPGDLLLGKYRVEHVLGRGGMGIVLAARHVELGELFAIKVMLPQALGDPGAVERFLREARATARLRSEHIARVVDAGRLEKGGPYMVMEYLRGYDLAALLRSRSPLPLEEAAEYVLQACDAITEAHAVGIVHRDIKPANLFLTRRASGEPCIKVLDFGISKYHDGRDPALTQQGNLLGSPYYMSPEQMADPARADARSDIWSMGVVLYRLVTGTLPFGGATLQEWLCAVQRGELAPPSALRPGLPTELDTVVARALGQPPEQRFQTIRELAMALRSAVGVTQPAARSAYPSLLSALDVPPSPPDLSRSDRGIDGRTSGQGIGVRPTRLSPAAVTAASAIAISLWTAIALSIRPVGQTPHPGESAVSAVALANEPYEAVKPDTSPTAAPPSASPRPTSASTGDTPRDGASSTTSSQPSSKAVQASASTVRSAAMRPRKQRTIE